MRIVPIEFIEQNIKEFFRHIQHTGEEVVITDQKQKPVFLLSTYRKRLRVEDVFRNFRGHVQYHDDILKPETEEWGDV